jgi:hypothetical protein
LKELWTYLMTGQTVQQMSRRHSELHKEPKNTKPASILKRKSCFASIACNDEVFEETVGKTPDHGRSVRFISPDVHDDTSVSNYRKTPYDKKYLKFQ